MLNTATVDVEPSFGMIQVFFFIDPEFATDPNMKGINNLILSYTFFKVEEAPQGASQPA